jgi:AbiV family abortive infection protein
MDEEKRPRPDNVPSEIPPEMRAGIAACLEHAGDLVVGAQALKEKNLPHLAYNLAALALEEVGKAELIGMAHIAKLKTERPPWVSKFGEDHLRKLFWAIWSPLLERQAMTPEKVQEIQGLATSIHSKRLQGLYVDVQDGGISIPRKAVGDAELENLLTIVGSRIELAKLAKPRTLDSEAREVLIWFLEATEDPEKRDFIFSRTSMGKLVELGASNLWVRWLRDEIQARDRECAEALKRELDRNVDNEGRELKDKWRVRIRIRSASHTIRQKDLKFWNEKVEWIKVTCVDKKKDEILVDFTFPIQVPIKALYRSALGASRRFVCALNIGSVGYFWWYLPEQVATYADQVDDLENKMKIKMERAPALRLDWARGALDEPVWKRVALAMTFLPYPKEKEKHEPFDHYLAGIVFMSKTDVHMQFEPNAYEAFYRALKSGLKVYGNWDGQTPFEASFNQLVDEVLPSLSQEDRAKYLMLGEQFNKRPNPELQKITLSEVGAMKVLCDAYFMRTFKSLARERAKDEDGAGKGDAI